MIKQMLIGTVGILFPTAASAATLVAPIAPPVLPQTPVLETSLLRSFDFGGYNITPGVDATFEFTRNGDFNNDTMVAGNGAPDEGIAVFLLDNALTRQHLIVFEPGIAGTVHDTTDDPVNRQSFNAPFSQDLLLDVLDGTTVHVEIVIGNSVDDLTYFDGSLSTEVSPVPEPSSLVLWSQIGIAFGLWRIAIRRGVRRVDLHAVGNGTEGL